MHELSVCQSFMRQVEQLARQHNASAVDRIIIAVGDLSGVEPELLQRAFTIARAGTVACAAQLEIQTNSIRVSCRTCGEDSDATANRLLCAQCGDWRVSVITGEELMLMSLELSEIPIQTQGETACATPAAAQ
jgi:hydrogenase nickel incorporation protein HypA/HybF